MMTNTPSPFEDRYTHLRAHAAAQKQATLDRLSQAVSLLEAQGRPVNTFTIKEVSGLDYMAYYRNREAFQLFQEHSTHLRKEREMKQANPRQSRRKRSKQGESLHRVKVSPRDPLLDYKRPRLIELLHEARTELDEAKRQLRAVRTETEQHIQAERVEWEQSYHKLLQEHMQCGVKFIRLEAELAEFRAFMERFRSSLQCEEQES